jgi:hypothetical protein
MSVSCAWLTRGRVCDEGRGEHKHFFECTTSASGKNCSWTKTACGFLLFLVHV